MTPPRQRDVLYDGLFTFAFRILNVACAAGLGILTARMLGPAGKGIYALPMVQSALVVSLFAGINGATSYFLLNKQVGKNILLPAFVGSVLFFVGASVGVVIVAAIGHQWWAALPAIASLPANVAVNLVTGYVIGVKRVRYATSITMAITVITFVLMAIGMFLIARNATVAIAVWLAGVWIVAALSITGMLIHSRTLPRGETVGVKEYTVFAGKVGAMQLISFLNYRADLYIVAVLASTAMLGIYTVAISAAESLLIPTQVAALVTSPHVGALDRVSAAKLTARCVRNNLLVALAVCGILFISASVVIRLLYGSPFEGAALPFRILLLGVVALSLGAPLSNFFTLKLGKPEFSMVLAGVSAVLCVGVAVALVPRYGLAGAALASTLAYIFGQLGGLVLFKQKTGIGMREMLVPTGADVAVYGILLRNVYTDGKRRLLGVPSR